MFEIMILMFIIMCEHMRYKAECSSHHVENTFLCMRLNLRGHTPQMMAKNDRQKDEKGDMRMFYVYVILCRNRTFYTGYTKDIIERLKQHLDGKGARYLRGNKVKKLYYIEKYRSQRKAIQREREIKKFTHLDKKKLIEKPYDTELVETINQALGLL